MLQTNDDDGIDRFIEPNEEDYEIALKEIKKGHKESHWIWYIYPQLRGLGQSHMSSYYGIKDLNEAKEYLNHPILGKRLIEITKTLLLLDIQNPIKIFGYIDAVKVKSCMTLFYLASQNKLFLNVLEKFYNGRFCEKTIQILTENKKINKKNKEKIEIEAEKKEKENKENEKKESKVLEKKKEQMDDDKKEEKDDKKEEKDDKKIDDDKKEEKDDKKIDDDKKEEKDDKKIDDNKKVEKEDKKKDDDKEEKKEDKKEEKEDKKIDDDKKEKKEDKIKDNNQKEKKKKI